MIPAHKNRFIGSFFAAHAEARLKRTFGALRVRGLSRLREITAEGPVLLVSNHTAWWDPLVAIWLTTRVLGVDAYAMMDAKNLRRLPFFGAVGAFGVDLDEPRDGMRAIRYGAKLLNAPGRLVWIFAQGREVPVTARPLGFRPGSVEIARVAKRAVVVPAALRYEHESEAAPNLYVALGEPLAPGDRDHEAAVTAELDRIDRGLVLGAREEFEVIASQRPSWFFRVAQAALAFTTRKRLAG